ncbi:MAG: D-TA family PLP-dependent enzyme [Bacteroidales bacterium]|nr:D-TA family PLP-dependent enzyme [Bacteroidales bacterium]
MNESVTINDRWYEVENVTEVYSPALLVYPDRIEENIRRMIKIAKGAKHLRPHVKTHKMAEVVMLQMKHGITKFKCATISEAEMAAKCGAPDILLAMQPVGPNLERFFKLKQTFENIKISCIADNGETIIQLSDMARKTGLETHVWVDINVGMNRTGVIPGEKTIRLFNRIVDSPMLVAEGLHVYDGHIHEPDPAKRKLICDEAFSPIESMIEELKHEGITPVKIIAGGTPSFPLHAQRKGVELSPGTILLWDYGYSTSFTDMDFLHAAILLTRIVSKPAKELLCLDLGHKALASEMTQPRVKLLGLKSYSVVGHNEEHMVIKTNEADKFNIGDHLYGIPWHICPTVDRHENVTIVTNNRAAGQWIVAARKRKITI